MFNFTLKKLTGFTDFLIYNCLHHEDVFKNTCICIDIHNVPIGNQQGKCVLCCFISNSEVLLKTHLH